MLLYSWRCVWGFPWLCCWKNGADMELYIELLVWVASTVMAMANMVDYMAADKRRRDAMAAWMLLWVAVSCASFAAMAYGIVTTGWIGSI